jgi:hypothetical protein
LGYGEMDGLDDEIRAQIFHQHSAPFTVHSRFRPVNAVGQLKDANYPPVG